MKRPLTAVVTVAEPPHPGRTGPRVRHAYEYAGGIASRVEFAADNGERRVTAQLDADGKLVVEAWRRMKGDSWVAITSIILDSP